MMDYLKVTAKELSGKDSRELVGAEREVRKTLAQIRLDVYTAPAVNAGKAKRLKKALARILTVAAQQRRSKV